jgi:uncharacterized protein (TIGR03437 family)
MVGQAGKCLFFGVVLVLILAGTSNGLFGQLLYVGNVGDDTISTYVIDQDSGLLTEILPRVGSPGSPSSVAIHPSGKFVYVTNGGNAALGANGPSIAEFSIDPNTGALTLLSSVPLTPGTGPQGAAIDAAGSFLFVAQAGPGNVGVYSIDPSAGTLSPVPGSPFAALPNVSKVVVHPSGKFAYASTGATSQIVAFNIDGSGALTPVAGSPFAARNNLFWMAMDAAGQFLFAIERQDPGVLVYSVDRNTGALTPVAGSPFSLPPGSTPTSVAVDPAGKFLYVSTAGNGGVNVFTIGATGALSQSRSFGAITSAFDAILDPSGRFLYVPGQQVNGISGLAIDSNSGALSPLPQQFFQAGNSPTRGATILLSPPVIPPISADSVFNYHSHEPAGMPNASVAQGSRIAIAGKNIGPAAGAGSQSSDSLQTTLSGVSIQIQSGDTATAALMVFVSNNFVTAVVPSTTPLGPAMVTVTYNGRTTAPIPMTVVTTSVGIRTVNDLGSGPARARNATPDTGLNTDITSLPLNALNHSATPGQFILVQATGLGPVTTDETQQNLTQVLAVPADVLVGNKIATTTLEVRASQGSDFILFKLPDDVQQGCYVPLAIRAGGEVSNVASLSISSTGASCSDPGGLAASDIDAAQKSGQMRMGTIVLGRLNVGPLGQMDFVNGIFSRYDFNSVLAAFSPGNNGQGIRGAFATPPLGTCSVAQGAPTKPNNPFDSPGDPVFAQFLNAGQALSLNGPPGTVQLPAPNYSFNPDGDAIMPGDYTVDNGSGTPAVGPFKAAITLPPPLTWTNMGAVAAVDRTQDLTVTWSGGNSDKEFVLIVGLSDNSQAVAGYLCTEKVSAGQFTVPAWVLSSIPASATFTGGGQSLTGGLLGVGTAALTSVGRFTGNGLDFGVITYEQASVSVVPYQ